MLKPLTAEEIATEQKNWPVKPHVATTGPELPLLNLHDRQFEQLAYFLLEAEARSSEARHDRTILLREGADRARDLLLYRERQLVGIVQCKRKSAKVGRPEVIREILRYCLHAVRDAELAPKGAASYEMWTAAEITADGASFLEDENVSRVALAALTHDAVDSARGKHVGLKKPSNAEKAAAEADAVLDLAQRLTLKHVGPHEICRRLSANREVRRSFFRVPGEFDMADVTQVAELVADHRVALLDELNNLGAAGDHPYVRPARLFEAFDDFMIDDARIFSVIGGSGNGKTSWAGRLTEDGPAGWSVDMILAEDLEPQDRNITASLSRMLAARRTGDIPMDNFGSAIWRWMDAENRILVIDGIDRASGAVRAAFPRWLRETARLTREVPVRIVLTSRLEAWRDVATDIQGLGSQIYHGHSDGVSFALGALQSAEAAAVYDAYEVSPKDHGGRPLPTPSLIRRFALLKGDAGLRGVTTRADVLSADLAQLEVSIRKRRNVGATGASLLFLELGRLLAASQDGWVRLVDLAAGGVLEGAEELVREDRARLRNGELRPDTDDMIELLIGRVLTLDTTLALLTAGRTDALLVGGIAMMVARLESGNREDAAAALGRIVDQAPPGATAHLDAVARSLLEVRFPADFLECAEAVIALWTEDNFMLLGSQLGDLLNGIALPPSDRLRLMLPLVGGEDEQDWREKFWFSPDLPGRFVTPFAAAATAAVCEDVAGTVPTLLPLLDDSDPKRSAVASYLLREAALVDADVVLRTTWASLCEGRASGFEIAASSVPGPAISFLGDLLQTDSRAGEVLAWRICDLALDPFEQRPAAPSVDEVLPAIAAVLPHVDTLSLQAKLLIVSLRYASSEEARMRLVALWPHVGDDDYWAAVKVAGADAERLLLQLIDGTDVRHDRRYQLERISPRALEGTDRPMIFDKLAEMAFKHPEDAFAIAGGVEKLSYAITPTHDERRALETLAAQLAASSDDAVRRQILYYAGTPTRRDSPPADEICRRERLLNVLIEHETGGCLQQLMWKLGESAHERPDALGHAMKLVRRFGRDAVLASAAAYGMLPTVKRLRDELKGLLDG